jgi:hypothetical protein
MNTRFAGRRGALRLFFIFDWTGHFGQGALAHLDSREFPNLYYRILSQSTDLKAVSVAAFAQE